MAYDELPKPSYRQKIVLLGAVLNLAYLATCIHRSSRVYLFQQAQCRTYYSTRDPSRIDSHSHVDEAFCKLDEVQTPLAIIDGIDSFLQELPALLVLAIYEKYLPIVGLRHLVILSIICSSLGVLFSTIVFWLHPPWTTQIALLSFVYDLIGGGENTRVMLIYTGIAYISPPDQLTKFYNYISATWLLASVGGSAIGSLLLSNHVWLLNAFSMLCYALTACIAATISSQMGRDALGEEDSRPILLASDDPDSPAESPERAAHLRRANTKPPLHQILLTTWQSSYHSILTLFTLPNPTFTVLLIFLINTMSQCIDVILPQYTSLTLHWPLSSAYRLLALKSFVASLVLFILPSLRKLPAATRLTTPQLDLFIIQAALSANTLGTIGLGFSASTTFFILAMCIYTLGNGVYDSLTAFGTLTLPPGGKVSQFYVRTGLMNTIAAIVGGPLWSLIFSFALGSTFLPLGLPYWICAGCFGAGIGAARVLKMWMTTGNGGAMVEQRYEQVINEHANE